MNTAETVNSSFIKNHQLEERSGNGPFFVYKKRENTIFVIIRKNRKETTKLKQPKKLTRSQKEFLTKKGIDASKWMLLNETKDTVVFIHKERLEVKRFSKDEM